MNRRLTVYYTGMVVGAIGFLCFISVFVSGALHFGDFSNFEQLGRLRQEARRDVEPWARMTGGVVKDAMDEAGLKLGGQPASEGLPFDERLRRLQKLRQDGLISEQEYETTKQKILESA